MSKEFNARPAQGHEGDTKQRALLIAEIAQSKHAEEIVIFEMTTLSSLADFFVVCTVDSTPQMRAVSEAVDGALSKEGVNPLGIEGRNSGVWLLMDYGDIILHIFHRESRDFYGLDRLWGDAPQISLSDIGNDLDAIEGGSN